MEDLMYEFVVIALLSGIVIFICGKIKLPPVVGYLLTGAVFGPSALGLVKEMQAVENMADIGVVFLLFSIGMGLSISELIRLKRQAFLGGSIQVVATVAAFTGLAHWWGMPINTSIFLGFLFSLSSTAIVLSIMEQQGRVGVPSGTFNLAVLIFQDIAAVPMMLAIPLLAGTTKADAASILITLGRTVGIAVIIFMLARKIVPKILKVVVRSGSRELFLITVLGICLGTAFLTSLFGLSLTLGAFMAGLVVAESEYSYSALEGIMPFKDVLTSIFFISMGMLLDLNFLAHHITTVMFFTLLVLVIKGLIAGGDVLLLGYPLRPAIVVGMALGQVGEFSFVLAKNGLDAKLLHNETYQLFLAVSILTMLSTPFLMAASPAVASRLDKRFGKASPEEEETASDPEAGQDGQIMIIGFGPAGKLCAWAAAQAGLKYVVLEMNPDTVHKYSQAGEPIYFGDAIHGSMLEHYGLAKAKALVIAISDPAAALGITQIARQMNSGLHIITRTRFLAQVENLKKRGADEVIAEEFETSIEIFVRMLGYCHIPRKDVGRMVRQVRAQNYASLRYTAEDEDLEALRAQLPDLIMLTFVVQKGALLDGHSFRETDTRVHVGLTIVAVKRGDTLTAHPGDDFGYMAGDMAYTVLSESDLPRVRPLFTAPVGGKGSGGETPQLPPGLGAVSK